MKLQIYTEKGTKSGSVDLPKELDVKANTNLLTQAFYVYENRSHKGTSMVKTRSMINATGAKMFKQKGTGRARHGDAKAPIFVGGGIAHGPKGVKRELTLSKNLKKRSLGMALSEVAKEGRLIVMEKVDGITKTKLANELLNKLTEELKLKRPARIVISLSEGKQEVIRNFRNIEDVRIVSWKNLNTYDVLSSNLLLTDKEALTKNKSNKTTKTEKLNKDIKIETPKAKKIEKVTKKVASKAAKTTKKVVSKKTIKKVSKKK